MEKIKRKKTIIGSIYILIFILIVWSIGAHFIPKETCFDGMRNQNEEDVDCGGVCAKKCDKVEVQALAIKKSGAVPAGIVGKYDFYAQVSNPNYLFGSQKFEYEAIIKNSSGNVVARREGSEFILPGETKYIVETNMEPSGNPDSAELKIKNSNWVQFNEYYEKPKLKVINKTYNILSDGTGFSEARGLLQNQSEFDFTTIKIQIILTDENGKVLALNSTQMDTVKSGEERDWRIFWPSRFSGEVRNVEAYPEVNIFSSDAFFKKFYKAQTFQQY